MADTAASSRRVGGVTAIACAAVVLAGCQSSSSTHTSEAVAPLDESPIFSSSEYGVPASPRVTNLKRVQRGGGRDQIGRPYQVRGKWYTPKEDPGYVNTGKASWYGSNFHGRLTANGEVYDMYHLSAAHPTMPLPSYARVTNKSNGRSVMVRVNDRGPYAHGRIVDVSQRAAEVLGFRNAGVADVQVEYVGRAPLEGDDGPMLMASFRDSGSRAIDDGLPSGVMIASRESAPTPAGAVSLASFNGTTPLPGVRPAGAAQAIDAEVQPAASMVPASAGPLPAVPLPTLRDFAMSYAPSQSVQSGAFRALAEITAQGASGERIELGAIGDLTTLMRLEQLIAGKGNLVEDREGSQVSLAFEIAPGQDTDAVLAAAWAAGAEDAFVLRD